MIILTVALLAIAISFYIDFIMNICIKDITKFKRYLNELNISYTEVGSTIRISNKIFTFDEKGKIVKE